MGIILPQELMDRLHLSKGDSVTVTETSHGVELRPHDREFAEGMALAEKIMQEDRDVLQRLAQ